MFQPKIIFFDIDDTLYIKKQHRIPDSARQALKQLKKQGIITAIATGRSPSVMPEAALRLIEECGIDWIVSINGQYVSYRGQPIMDFPISSDTVAQTTQHLHSLGINYAFVGSETMIVLREDNYLQRAAEDLRLPYEICSEYPKHLPIYQLLAFFPQEYDANVQAILSPSLRMVRWHPCGVDILDVMGSKVRGIQAVLHTLGLDLSDAMAFGDGANDAEMLSAVGFGVAMGNASPELKRLAQYVCPTAAEDGIQHALRHLKIIT